LKITLIAVCHYSSGVLPTCIESFRRAADQAGVEAEVIAVEQSEDTAEEVAVAACGPDLMLVRENRGYAAGLNAGADEATGELLFLANPDIEFLAGSVGALRDAVASGAGVAGPQLLWDRDGEVLLPIPDDPSPTAEIVRTVRRRWPRRRGLERRIEASWRVWTAQKPCETPSLRGPLMAVTREALATLGPLDEEYFLYYEETEWLWRARRRGVSLQVVPTAGVVHRWGHSTSRRSDQARIEERSRVRFFQRNYPAVARRVLERLAAPAVSLDHCFERVTGPQAVCCDRADVWLLSIVSHMEPLVGCIGGGVLPPAAVELTSAGRWYAVAAQRIGGRWQRIGAWMWEIE